MSESPLPSLTAARVVIVAGKGGVGKTTVTAVLARAAVTDGRRVLVVELDGKPTLADWFADVDADLPDGARLDVIHLSAADALDEYLREHGFQRIAKRLSSTGVIDMVGTAAPGIDDVVVLGKIKQLERAGDHDLIIVDGPAAGHAITFLTSASGLADAVRGGPVKRQSDDVLELLADGDRAMVVLGTLPETTPVNETVETAFSLEDDVGVRLGPVVVNAVDAAGDLPAADEVDEALAAVESGEAVSLRAAWEFRRSRRAMEVEALDRLGERLPLAQVHLPALPVAGLSASDIDVLASQLTEDGST